MACMSFFFKMLYEGYRGMDIRRLQVEATGSDSTLLPPMTSMLIIIEARGRQRKERDIKKGEGEIKKGER